MESGKRKDVSLPLCYFMVRQWMKRPNLNGGREKEEGGEVPGKHNALMTGVLLPNP